MLDPTQVERVMAFGDWHANTEFAVEQLMSRAGEADVYVHVGDFGIWPTTIARGYVDQIEDELARQNRELWFIDGNHEFFPILEELELDERGLGIVSDHIFYIPRGHAWEWGGKRFMGVGGAVSVDQDQRTPGSSWFPQELITDHDVDVAVKNGPVDVLFTHDSIWNPLQPRSFGTLIDFQNQQNMRQLTRIVDAVKPEILIHGHYHLRHNRSYADDFHIVGLGMDRGSLEDNFVVLDVGNL